MRPSHHTVQSDPPPAFSIPLQCLVTLQLSIRVASFPTLFEIYRPPISVPLSSISHHFPFTSSLPRASPSASPLIPLCSDEGVGSAVINDRQERARVREYTCCDQSASSAFISCKGKQADMPADACPCLCRCVHMQQLLNQSIAQSIP